MNITLDYNNKQYEFPLWTNKLEKEILLTLNKTGTCQENMKQMFPIINRYKELEDIHYIDKLWIYLKSREYSIGNVIESMIICKNCNQINNIKYKISENTIFKTSPSHIPCEWGDVKIINSKIYLNDILLQDVEDLDVVVNVKNNVLKNIQHQLLISYQHPCMKCNNINTVLHTEQEVLNDVIASIEVVELYKYYTNMQYNYQMSHADLDNMYSFERNIYKGMYENITKEKNEG